jgi:hypothetical protein
MIGFFENIKEWSYDNEQDLTHIKQMAHWRAYEVLAQEYPSLDDSTRSNTRHMKLGFIGLLKHS